MGEKRLDDRETPLRCLRDIGLRERQTERVEHKAPHRHLWGELKNFLVGVREGSEGRERRRERPVGAMNSCASICRSLISALTSLWMRGINSLSIVFCTAS
jgi:hypothetical protein